MSLNILIIVVPAGSFGDTISTKGQDVEEGEIVETTENTSEEKTKEKPKEKIAE